MIKATRTDLTNTEQTVVAQVCAGKSNAEAADAMDLSPRTVETYRLRLMRKLGIEDFATLVKWAIRERLTGGEV